ncbi:hypothetical protein PO909_029833 [Leuciscus waleckii]
MNSTTQLLEGAFRHCVIFFYQPFSPQTDLVIVLQTPSMRDNLQEYGRDIVFMDATHGVNQNGFPLFTLVVRDSHGHGIPIAYIILGNEKQAMLQLTLEKLKPTFSVAPKCFMVDKDQAEINAIRKVFNESDVLLCWYHVTQVSSSSASQSVQRLFRNMNPYSDALNQMYNESLPVLQEHEFKKKAEMFHCQLKNLKDVCKYFRNHWEPIGHLWSNFGRCYKHGDPETNNLIERYTFLCMFTLLVG